MRSGRSRRTRAIALSIALAATTIVEAYADDPLHVVLAQTGASSLILWNATPIVASIVEKHIGDEPANDVLERTALRAAALELPSLTHAKTIAVRVLYDQTGDVSPVYGSATFARVQRYALLILDGAKARQNADRWRDLRPHDPIPAWISYRVVGTLPPR